MQKISFLQYFSNCRPHDLIRHLRFPEIALLSFYGVVTRMEHKNKDFEIFLKRIILPAYPLPENSIPLLLPAKYWKDEENHHAVLQSVRHKTGPSPDAPPEGGWHHW